MACQRDLLFICTQVRSLSTPVVSIRMWDCVFVLSSLGSSWSLDFFTRALLDTSPPANQAPIRYHTCCFSTRRGHDTTRLEENALAYHVDVTLFKIVHSCSIRQGALHEARKLLLQHKMPD
jgi:hypothetical protein